jgi:hypothetical protein
MGGVNPRSEIITSVSKREREEDERCRSCFRRPAHLRRPRPHNTPRKKYIVGARVEATEADRAVGKTLPQSQVDHKRGGVSGGTGSEVSTFRLYLLRAGYLYIAIGLALTRWPEMLFRAESLSRTESVISSVLVAVSLLAVLGLRYPLKMLPLLFWEFLWKAIWVVVYGLPAMSSGQGLDPNAQETMLACLMGIVLVPIVTPWGYVLAHYVKARAEPWRKQVTSGS